MNEQNLLTTLKALQNVKPRQNWVVLAKQRILDEASAGEIQLGSNLFGKILDESFSFLKYLEKPAFVLSALSVIVGGAVFQMSRNSLPGDALYVLRSTAEQTQLVLSSTSGGEKSFKQLQFAHNRLDDMKRIAERSQTKNLAPAIKEFERNMSEASKGLSALIAANPGKTAEVSKELESLIKNRTEVEKVLGAKIGQDEKGGELETLAKVIAEHELKELEDRALTSEQDALYDKARASYEAGEYQDALEAIWTLSQR